MKYRHLLKSLIAITLILAFAAMCSSLGSPTGALASETVSYEKMSKALLTRLDEMTENDVQSVYIWVDELNMNELMSTFKTKNPAEYDTYMKAKYGDDSGLTLEAITTAVGLKRSIYAELNSRHMHEILDCYTDGKTNTLTFVSLYAPLAIAQLTKPEIQIMAKDNSVNQMDLYVELEPVNFAMNALTVSRAKFVRDLFGYTGEGVNIGQIEADLPLITNSEIYGKVTLYNPPSPRLPTPAAMHATAVATTLVGDTYGCAPDANLYSRAFSSVATYHSAVEWLIDSSRSVSVINMSAGFCETGYVGTYSTICQWTDYIIHTQDVSMVFATGNQSQIPSLYVASPAMAYNAIAVGAYNDHNTTSETDDTFCSFSCYRESSTIANKPDLIAPGENINYPNVSFPTGGTQTNDQSGTSFSAPLVAGTIAQLMDYKPSLTVKPELVKAIIMASAINKINPDDYLYGISSKEGVGKLNAVEALHILSDNDNYAYATVSGNSFPVGQTFYLEANKPARIVVSWAKQNTLETGSGSALSQINLYLKNSSGQIVSFSLAGSNNAKVIEFTPTSSGNFTLTLARLTTAVTSNETVGIAMWQ